MKDKICVSKTLTYLVALVAVVVGAFYVMGGLNNQKIGGAPRAAAGDCTSGFSIATYNATTGGVTYGKQTVTNNTCEKRYLPKNNTPVNTGKKCISGKLEKNPSCGVSCFYGIDEVTPLKSDLASGDGVLPTADPNSKVLQPNLYRYAGSGANAGCIYYSRNKTSTKTFTGYKCDFKSANWELVNGSYYVAKVSKPEPNNCYPTKALTCKYGPGDVKFNDQLTGIKDGEYVLEDVSSTEEIIKNLGEAGYVISRYDSSTDGYSPVSAKCFGIYQANTLVGWYSSAVKPNAGDNYQYCLAQKKPCYGQKYWFDGVYREPNFGEKVGSFTCSCSNDFNTYPDGLKYSTLVQ